MGYWSSRFTLNNISCKTWYPANVPNYEFCLWKNISKIIYSLSYKNQVFTRTLFTKSHAVFMICRIIVLEISGACNFTKNIAFQSDSGQLTCSATGSEAINVESNLSRSARDPSIFHCSPLTCDTFSNWSCHTAKRICRSRTRSGSNLYQVGRNSRRVLIRSLFGECV